MAQLTPDQKREIAGLLGYRLIEREGTERRDLIGPDGRHRGIFRPSRAADTWIWNDAVFQFELYRDRAGAVHRRVQDVSSRRMLECVWPVPGEKREFPPEALAQDFERLSGGQLS